MFGKKTKIISENLIEFEFFFRIGKKSARLVRMAATRLAVELLAMIRRPAHAVITKTLEGYI